MIMPYDMIVGQEQLKLALELAFISPRIGGVLLSGQRGTGKSTVVRAFAVAAYGGLPVTLPINATEDRVVGGWDIMSLFGNAPERRKGLLEEANGKLLYIDEVNLLDDHIVNTILDVTSTGVLVIQREGIDEPDKDISFTLVGTMNPSEGGLRPQLLDRFGLMVDVVAETNEQMRAAILERVLEYDTACAQQKADRKGPELKKLVAARKKDEKLGERLRAAKQRFAHVSLPRRMAEACARIGQEFQSEGHRGDYVMALAARARAAQRGAACAEPDDVLAVAPMALQHRRPGVLEAGRSVWTLEDSKRVGQLLGIAKEETMNASPQD
jgi:magnesium chelatase subunit I